MPPGSLPGIGAFFVMAQSGSQWGAAITFAEPLGRPPHHEEKFYPFY